MHLLVSACPSIYLFTLSHLNGLIFIFDVCNQGVYAGNLMGVVDQLFIRTF